MHTAATGGTSGSSLGWRAFWQRDRTFPGVSFPSRVVRSTIETAVVRPHNFDFFLMLRVANLATRSSTPTWSTEPVSSSRRLNAARGAGGRDVEVGDIVFVISWGVETVATAFELHRDYVAPMSD